MFYKKKSGLTGKADKCAQEDNVPEGDTQSNGQADNEVEDEEDEEDAAARAEIEEGEASFLEKCIEDAEEDAQEEIKLSDNELKEVMYALTKVSMSHCFAILLSNTLCFRWLHLRRRYNILVRSRHDLRMSATSPNSISMCPNATFPLAGIRQLQ